MLEMKNTSKMGEPSAGRPPWTKKRSNKKRLKHEEAERGRVGKANQ